MLNISNPRPKIVISEIVSAADVPACKHFCPCTEKSGTVMRDVKSGVSIDVAYDGHAMTFHGSGGIGVTDVGTNAPHPIQGTWAPFDPAKYILMVAAGRVMSIGVGGDVVRTSMGDLNGIISIGNLIGIALSDNSFHAAVGGPWNYLTETRAGLSRIESTGNVLKTIGADKDVVSYYLVKPNDLASQVCKSIDLDTGTVLLSATTTSTLGANPWTAGPFTPDPYFRFSGIYLYGWAQFQFDTLPTDAEIASLWMGYQWRAAARANTPKSLYLGYRGKS